MSFFWFVGLSFALSRYFYLSFVTPTRLIIFFFLLPLIPTALAYVPLSNDVYVS